MAGINESVLVAPARRWEMQSLLFTLLLGVLAFLVLYPLFLLLLNSFETARPGESSTLGFEAWRLALGEPGMRDAIFNTITLTLAGQLVTFPLAVFLAWLLARTDIPVRDSLEFLFWVGFFLPSLAVTQGWILLLDPQYGLLNQLVARLPFVDKGPFDIYTWWGIVWVHAMGATLAVKVMLLTPAFRNMDASLEEVSQVCGSNRLGTLVKIVVPLMAPVVFVVLLMAIIRSLEAFEIELILGAPRRINVYSTKIYRLVQQEPPLFGAATALSIVILGLMLPLIVLQRWFTSRHNYATITGRYQGHVIRLGRWRWPAFSFVVLVVSLLTIVPLVFLLVGTFMRLYGFFHLPDPWTLRHWRTVFADSIFSRSLFNTLILASGTALLSVFLYSIVGYVIVRTRFWGRAALDFLSWLLFALPGIILGLGYLWLFLGIPLFRPLYGGNSLLILASALSSMTLGVQIIKSTMLQLGFDLEEASWVAGGSRWQTFRRVLLPILTPVLLLVGVVSFISAARNISHLALLVTSANRPLAMLQLDYMVEGRYETASVAGVIVIAMTIGVALVARGFGLRLGIKHE